MEYQQIISTFQNALYLVQAEKEDKLKQQQSVLAFHEMADYVKEMNQIKYV